LQFNSENFSLSRVHFFHDLYEGGRAKESENGFEEAEKFSSSSFFTLTHRLH
jgi:hypothetical protein